MKPRTQASWADRGLSLTATGILSRPQVATSTTAAPSRATSGADRDAARDVNQRYKATLGRAATHRGTGQVKWTPAVGLSFPLPSYTRPSGIARVTQRSQMDACGATTNTATLAASA